MGHTILLVLAGCALLPFGDKDEDPTGETIPDDTIVVGDDDDDDDDDTTPWTSSTWTSSSTTDTGTTTGTVTLPTGLQVVSLYDLQGGIVPVETEVGVRDVVVTATAAYGFYAQERGGGQGSAIWVYGGIGWEAAWPAEPGDRVDLVGRYSEFFGLSELDLTTATAPVVDLVGTVPVPAPALVPLADLQSGSAEGWESVLIRVEDLVITNPDAGNGEFEVGDGRGDTLLVDDQIHTFGAFGALPVGAAIEAVSGVLNYSDNAFKIEPRSEDDIETAAATIFQIQRAEIPLGNEVEVYGVAVTATAYDGLYAQDPAGGEYSGVWVYLGVGWESLYGTVSEGDRIELRGIAQEYYDLTEIDLTTAAQPRLAVISSGAIPAPAPVAVADVSEPWEGVLIEISDVIVSTPDLGFGEWEVTPRIGGGTDFVVVDDRIHPWSGAATLATGDRFDAIAGPLHYNFGAYKLEPRGEFDVDPH